MFRSLIECGAICKQVGCHNFKHDQDQQVCQLASLNGDWCVPNSTPVGPEDPDVYSDVNHDILQLKIGETSKPEVYIIV